jgi:hypothetical protein
MAQLRDDDKEMAEAIGLGHLNTNRTREARERDAQEMREALGLDHLAPSRSRAAHQIDGQIMHMTKIIDDVRYVHAAAQDIVPSAMPTSKWYFVGDIVKVDLRDGGHVEVKLTLADEVVGTFEGAVMASADPRYMLGDVVSFNYHV